MLDGGRLFGVQPQVVLARCSLWSLEWRDTIDIIEEAEGRDHEDECDEDEGSMNVHGVVQESKRRTRAGAQSTNRNSGSGTLNTASRFGVDPTCG